MYEVEIYSSHTSIFFQCWTCGGLCMIPEELLGSALQNNI